ncbi:ASN_collapsed_G0052650.mRNA.1.CDS.1 [Saccharomyces cerevisiae]|nr:ASN_collapsed_G0052650.mRNA.1.CDS.1 [Saccharomyces cerevisiae]
MADEEEEIVDTYQEDIFVSESPSFVKSGKLRDYQVQGLNWLISLHENKLSGILADEMGLGKTLQTISFLGYLRYVKQIEGPFLIIVPKSTLDNWRREFLKWTPNVNVLVLHGDKDTRADIVRNIILEARFDVLITSYEMVIREKNALKRLAWQYIVIDEAHRIKNEQSALSQIIRLFYSKNRLLITGTPLQNNLHELWALLNFLLPDIFGDSELFDEWFEQNNSEQDQEIVVQQLHSVLNPFLLRRVKADVEKSLLPKIETNVYVGMTDMQIQWYKSLLEKDIDAVNGAVGKREGKTRLLNIVMQLRKCCNHPYLFEGAEPGPPYTTDEHLIFNSGKMIILDKLLKRLKEKGSRVLIFSQMSRLLDILEDYCYFRDFEYCRIDGSTSHEERIEAIDEYNKPNSEKLDQLVIQQGTGKKTASLGNSKDDLLDMIQFGAKNMFEKKASKVTVDADIDDILKKGEQKTQELNAKYQSLGLDDLQKFNGIENQSAYEWNGKSFQKKSNDKVVEWINPSRRERRREQTTYSVDDYYKEIIGGSDAEEEEEGEYKNAANTEGHKGHEELKRRIEEEQEKINSAPDFTQEDELRKQELISKAFTNWNKRDFMAFINACAKYGRDDMENIKKSIDSKTPEEVEMYAKIFWERLKEINGWEKYLHNVELGEKKNEKLKFQETLLRQKIEQCKHPLHELIIQYPPNNARRTYNTLEDKFLLLAVNKYGLRADKLYEKLKQEIMMSDLFTFDWFIKTRTVHELSKRVHTLLTLIVREYEQPDANKKKRSRTSATREDTPLSQNESTRASTVPNLPTTMVTNQKDTNDHVDKRTKIDQEA